MASVDDPAAILSVLVDTALEASQLVKAAFGRCGEPAIKADASPVTEADTAAERLIAARLAAALPDLPIVAEEAIASGHLPAHLGRRFILVDPIDGTREFVGGHGDFTVNIALVEDGRPILGVVVAPAYGEIFVGSPAGAFKSRMRPDGRAGLPHTIGVRPRPAIPVVLVSRSRRPTPEVIDFLAHWHVSEAVPVGSSLKFCRLAEGAADLHPGLGRTMEWDTAAGQAVLEAAGGSVLGLDGLPIAYGKRGRPDIADFANPYFVASGLPAPLPATSGASDNSSRPPA